AVTGFEQALDAVRHLADGRERTEQAIDLHLEVAAALLPTGAQAKSAYHAGEARTLAEALGDAQRLGWACVWVANQAWSLGQSDLGLHMAERVLAIATDRCDVSLEVAANYQLGLLGQTRGSYRLAAERLRRVAEALQGERLYDRYGRTTVRSVS